MIREITEHKRAEQILESTDVEDFRTTVTQASIRRLLRSTLGTLGRLLRGAGRPARGWKHVSRFHVALWDSLL